MLFKSYTSPASKNEKSLKKRGKSVFEAKGVWGSQNKTEKVQTTPRVLWIRRGRVLRESGWKRRFGIGRLRDEKTYARIVLREGDV